jgi:Flp pilus assembly pilin Flp
MREELMRLWKEDQGQDLAEYALILVLISLVSIATLKPIAFTVSDVFSNAASNFVIAGS